MALLGYLDKVRAADYTSVCVRVLDYAKARGEIPYYKVGARCAFAVTDLDKWMSRFRVEHVAQEGGAE